MFALSQAGSAFTLDPHRQEKYARCTDLYRNFVVFFVVIDTTYSVLFRLIKKKNVMIGVPEIKYEKQTADFSFSCLTTV